MTIAETLAAPAADEYAPYYLDYIQRMRGRAVHEVLPAQIREIRDALEALSDAQARFRPAAGEWSIKEVMGHMNDVERVFSYRLLRVSRNDQTPLPGFEQDDFVRAAGFDDLPLGDLIDEFEYLRKANVLAIQALSAEASSRRGTASGASVSARALVYMLAGHVDHHMQSLREKYLPAVR